LQKNPKYPEFEHKDAGEALWLEARYYMGEASIGNIGFKDAICPESG